jgi:hypothetical protein
MASTKRQSDDSDSDWEGAPRVKQLRTMPTSGTGQLQGDRVNYGSASSQRPARVRKPPERYINAPLQPPVSKRKIGSSAKPASIVKRSSTATSFQVPERKSRIVRLKIPLATLKLQSSQQHHEEHSDSELSSPPGSLPSSPVCTAPRFGLSS